MKYCQHCGAELNDDALFCSACGSKTNEIEVTQQASSSLQARNAREDTARELRKLYDYFSKKENLYKEYDSITFALPVYQKDANGNNKLLVASIIFAILSFLGLYITWISKSPYALIAFMMLFIIPTVIMFLIFFLSKKGGKERLQNSSIRYDEIVNELAEYYVNYGYSPIGMEYTNPEIIRTLLDIVRQGRADSIKEAINIMIADSHRDQMEMFAAQNVANSAAAANGARISAVFCAANFIRHF